MNLGSILKMVEEVYNLPSLNYADARADDFADCFDFNQTPVVFKPFAAKYHGDYFINDKSRPLPPDTE